MRKTVSALLKKKRHMEISDEEKARIDYEIKAKREDKEKELSEWVYAAFRVVLFFAFVIFVLKIISTT